MPLDARDCRLDIACILGDDNVPDSVDWPSAERDRTCVWLDFADSIFDPRVADTYNTCTDVNEAEVAFIVPPLEMPTSPEPSMVYALPSDVVATPSMTAVHVCPLPAAASMGHMDQTVRVHASNNTVNQKASQNSVQVKTKKNVVNM